MNQEKKVFDLKMIVPWYDAESVCYIQIAFTVLVFLFGVAGLLVAREHVEYHGYIWVPGILMGMSVIIFLSTVIRLGKRIHYRLQNRYLKGFRKLDSL